MKHSALIGLLTLLPLTAGAGDEVGQLYFNPQIGAIVPDGKRELNDSLIWGAGLGMNFSRAWSAEINFNDARLDYRHMPGHQYPYAISLDAPRVWRRGELVSPYVSFGIGGLQNFNAAAESNDFLAQAGVGLMIKLWENSEGSASFWLRPDLKVRYDADTTDH